ncbi:MAG: ferrous iron transporter B [Ignavibacteriae bacterium]|nr:ferrous iron transporter B [Ignavibacteriota bacterium]
MTTSATIAFVGTPNSGKSTLFNVLTGLRQKVGNFPGVTVEAGIGIVTTGGKHFQLIDLPGTYSLSPKSRDEELTLAVLQGRESTLPKPDAVVFIIDGTNVEKGLFLFSHFAELGLPTIVVVTMIDAIKAQGGALDDITLERELGVPVLSVVGHKGIGIEELTDQFTRLSDFAIPKKWVDSSIEHHERYSSARELAHLVINIRYNDKRSELLDRIFLHPIIGPAIFLIVMALFFQSIFTWSKPLMDGIDGGFGWLQDIVSSTLPEGLFRSFLTKGLIAGVGSVLIFLPQILLLNLFIVILEDCGYLSRAAFLVDRVMGVFSLQGRSFIPLLGSFACAIPGIMSARIIPSEKDRMATMLVAPLMTCSARLPVYALLISAFVPATLIGGFFSLQGMVLGGLYVLAAVSGLLIAGVFKRTMFRGSKLPFLIEFPPYRMPSLKSLFVTVWNRSKEFLRTAGGIILVLSVVLWALTEFPRTNIPAGTTAIEASRMQLEGSLAGQLGKVIQPIFAPLGFDWKLTIGVIGSFAAREVFISVMGQLYSADVSASDTPLREILATAIGLPTALAVLAFYVYALQCISTLAVLKRETGSWKWAGFAFLYTFILAYGFSFFVYRIALAW